jgi:hypothetical protein
LPVPPDAGVNREVLPEPLWAAAAACGFDSRQWGDDIVLYVVATGETHALAPAHSATLGLLLAHPGAPRTAAQWLNLMVDEGESGGDQAPPEPAELAAVYGALADLQQIGVVERLAA